LASVSREKVRDRKKSVARIGIENRDGFGPRIGILNYSFRTRIYGVPIGLFSKYVSDKNYFSVNSACPSDTLPKKEVFDKL